MAESGKFNNARIHNNSLTATVLPTKLSVSVYNSRNLASNDSRVQTIPENMTTKFKQGSFKSDILVYILVTFFV